MEKINLKKVIDQNQLHEISNQFETKQDYFLYLDQKKEYFYDNFETDYAIKIDKFQYANYNKITTYDEMIDAIFNMLNIECSALNLFQYVNDPKIICSFLFFNHSALIYDELFMFNENSFSVKYMMKNNYEKNTVFLHDLIVDVSKKIILIENNCVQEDDNEISIETIEVDEINLIPKTLNEAIESLLLTTTNNNNFYNNISVIYEKINFNDEISLEVITDIMFTAIFAIIYTGWYLDYYDSPLRIWFKENRNETNEFKIVHEIIKIFTANLILKNKDL